MRRIWQVPCLKSGDCFLEIDLEFGRKAFADEIPRHFLPSPFSLCVLDESKIRLRDVAQTRAGFYFILVRGSSWIFDLTHAHPGHGIS